MPEIQVSSSGGKKGQRRLAKKGGGEGEPCREKLGSLCIIFMEDASVLRQKIRYGGVFLRV